MRGLRACPPSSLINADCSNVASVLLRSSHSSSTHIPSAHNKPSIPFDFTVENYAKVENILSKYPSEYKMSAVIPLLDLAQRQNNNWLPLSAMNKVAKILDAEPMGVYEVASFYTMFNREPVGKHFIQLCTTTPCQLGGCGSDVIVETFEKELGIKSGQTTKDGEFTLLEVECLGACANAPMLQIGDHYYEDLTPESVKKMIVDLKSGTPLKPGPQSGTRRVADPEGGRTTLKGTPRGKLCRDLDKV